VSEVAIWHDVECGSYTEDLELWRSLATAAMGSDAILDVGAGTGRVTLDLARAGHSVLALDRDPALLDVLRRRARGLAVRTVVADAAGFALDECFALIIVPMQTVQLLGPAGRAGFLRCAREHLTDGGLVACALADALEAYDAEHTEPPLPDVLRRDGTVYASRPVALRDEGPYVAIERIRETISADGRRTASADVVRLDRLDAPTLEYEARAAGLHPEPLRWIPHTDEHVGSVVVMLRG
jgi:SAM-dependent methyltransferase